MDFMSASGAPPESSVAKTALKPEWQAIRTRLRGENDPAANDIVMDVAVKRVPAVGSGALLLDRDL